MLKKLMERREELMARFAEVNEADIQDSELRAKCRKLKAKQAGFTLLELLVVVAILAAIAGTATIALQDTDARAAAAAHVAMMDELNKGIRTFRVLRKGFPTDFDSLAILSGATATSDNLASNATKIELTDTASLSVTTATLLAHNNEDALVALEDNIIGYKLTADQAEGLAGVGISTLRYINPFAAPADINNDLNENCANSDNIKRLINSKANAVVAGNIFAPVAANGCGVTGTLTEGSVVAVWAGGNERVLANNVGEWGAHTGSNAYATSSGGVLADFGSVSGGNDGDETAPLFMAVGLGPGSTLFNSNDIGGLSSVPVYRHVSQEQYNRFTALFQIGKLPQSNNDVPLASVAVPGRFTFAAVVDGAGDTKEEELGEWDGTRAT